MLGGGQSLWKELQPGRRLEPCGQVLGLGPRSARLDWKNLALGAGHGPAGSHSPVRTAL